MKSKLLSIKNAEPYLLFNTLPTTQEQLKPFLSKMLTIARIEAETTVQDYQGFDFEGMKERDPAGHDENKAFLEKFIARLEAINNIEKKLTDINYHLGLFEFCSIFNVLFPYSYSVIDSYINFDFDRYLKESPDAYDEHINYINLFMQRADETLARAKAQNPVFKIPGNDRDDDLDKYLTHSDEMSALLHEELKKYLSPDMMAQNDFVQRLRQLSALGPILIRCTKAIEHNKSVVCSENENYLALVTAGAYSSHDVFIIDDENVAKKLRQTHYAHFDFTPLDSNEDQSEQFALLEIEAHRDWCKSIEYSLSRQDEILNRGDIVFWLPGRKEVSSNIDYSVPMFISDIDETNRTVDVISSLHKMNNTDGTGEYRPLRSLRDGCFVVETIPMYRITKGHY